MQFLENLTPIRQRRIMRLKKLEAVLQERPWLLKAAGSLTGTHPFDIKKSGGNWDAHVKNWVARNVLEIKVRPFTELNLDEKSGHVLQLFKQGEEVNYDNGRVGKGWRMREFAAFTHTRFVVFNHSTYEEKYKKPYAFSWEYNYEEFPQTVREGLHKQRRPHYPLGTNTPIDTPYIFDAVVRVLQVGISGMCSTTILDVFHFPADFDPSSI